MHQYFNQMTHGFKPFPGEKRRRKNRTRQPFNFELLETRALLAASLLSDINVLPNTAGSNPSGYTQYRSMKTKILTPAKCLFAKMNTPTGARNERARMLGRI
jgi:hypothetical protein